MKTLAEIESCGKDMLIPADIADYIGADPQSIRLQARANPAALGFPGLDNFLNLLYIMVEATNSRKLAPTKCGLFNGFE